MRQSGSNARLSCLTSSVAVSSHEMMTGLGLDRSIPVQYFQWINGLLHGGAVLEHVGADTRLGFGVGGGVGAETDSFGGLAVGHPARKDQVGKSYFLICDGVAYFVFWHRCSWSLELWT